MAKEISFPDMEPRYVFDRDILAFSALADGEPVECMVTAELLFSRFGAKDMTEASMKQAYGERREEIQAITWGHIENDWIDEDRRVFLTTRYTQLTVHYNDPGDLRHLMEKGQRVLTSIIGPSAEKVHVRWSRVEAPGLRTGIQVEISDTPTEPHKVVGTFSQRDWDDMPFLAAHLARLWSTLLRARSRDLILKSG